MVYKPYSVAEQQPRKVQLWPPSCVCQRGGAGGSGGWQGWYPCDLAPQGSVRADHPAAAAANSAEMSETASSLRMSGNIMLVMHFLTLPCMCLSRQVAPDMPQDSEQHCPATHSMAVSVQHIEL